MTENYKIKVRWLPGFRYPVRSFIRNIILATATPSQPALKEEIPVATKKKTAKKTKRTDYKDGIDGSSKPRGFKHAVNVDKLQETVSNLVNLGVEHETRISELDKRVKDARNGVREQINDLDTMDRHADRELRVGRARHEQQVEYIEKRTVLNVNENVANITDAVKCIAHANQALALTVQNLSTRHANAFIDLSGYNPPMTASAPKEF